MARRFLVKIFLPAVLLWFSGGVIQSAKTHAIIISSRPASGETITSKTVTIMLRFNSRIDVVRSRLILTRPDRTTVDLTPTPGKGPAEIVAAADNLGDGKYVLRWQALSVDGHITRGDIPFTVVIP